MLNERQIVLREGGNYAALNDFFDRRRVIPLPFDETARVIPAGVQHMLVIDDLCVATNLAVGVATVENAGLCAAEMVGAIDNAETTLISDSLGNVLNLVKLRDASTHDPIVTADDREVFGLIQSANGVADGTVIGAAASENTQISFVYVDLAGAIILTNVTATVEFMQNNVYLERHVPTITLLGGKETQDVIPPISADQGEYVVTTAFAADEVITLSTGAGAGSGVSTKTGETINLGEDAAAFNADNLLQVMLNGIEQRKGTDVTWDSSGTMHFALALDVDDYFEVRRLAN